MPIVLSVSWFYLFFLVKHYGHASDLRLIALFFGLFLYNQTIGQDRCNPASVQADKGSNKNGVKRWQRSPLTFGWIERLGSVW